MLFRSEITKGIENSVRVAFAQIGRVKGDAATSTEDVIRALDCSGKNNTSDALPTGICRVDNIWEPNDTAHYSKAMDYYQTSCKKRTSDTVYTTTCDSYAAGDQIPTYAIKQAIETGTVDIYDGLNEYHNNIASNASDETKPLYKKTYFTDSVKQYKGSIRILPT